MIEETTSITFRVTVGQRASIERAAEAAGGATITEVLRAAVAAHVDAVGVCPMCGRPKQEG